MRGRRAVAVLACLAMATAVGAAASASTAVADGPRQPFPKVDQPGVSDTEIRVGGVASITNPLGTEHSAAFDGAQAYFDMVNSSKDKGVYGRKLRLVSRRDDQLGSNRTEVQGLISEDNVFAALPVSVILFTGADLLGRGGFRRSAGTSMPSGAPSRARARRTSSARRARTCASRARASSCRGSQSK
jgi:hypothetical protein